MTAVVVEKVDWLKEGPVPQSRAVTLGCKQWLKPKPAMLGVGTLNAKTVAPVESSSAPAAPSTRAGARGPG